MARYLRQKTKNKKRGLVALCFGIAAGIGWIIYKTPKDKRQRIIRSMEDRLRKYHSYLVDFFIPHIRNEFKPKIFQKRAVRHLLMVVVLIKISLMTLLFALYPNIARLNQDIRMEMYRLINQYRTERNEKTLSVNAYLEERAGMKARDMVDNNYFSHFGIDGKKPWQWIDTSVYNYSAMGENLAMDFLTSGSVFRAFQKSPTHDKNLLSPYYSEIGISVMNGYLDGHDTNVMVVFFANSKTKKTAPIAEAQTEKKEAVEPAKAVEPSQPVEPGPVAAAAKAASEKLAQAPQVKKNPSKTIVPEKNEQPKSVAIAPQNTNTATNPQVTAPSVQPNIPTSVLGETTVQDPIIMAENMQGGVEFSKGSILQRVIGWTDKFLFIFLCALIALLIVNLIVKIEIQHKPIIANALLLIAMVGFALYFNIHQAEAMGEKVRILGSVIQLW